MHQKAPTPPDVTRGRGRPPATSADEIARTALRLFAAQGFEGTTMDDVAAAVGIARRTLFSYYRTKNDIVWDGRHEATEGLAEALSRVPTRTPWRPALAETLAAGLRYPGNDVDLLRRRLTLIGDNPSLQAHLDTDQRDTVDAVSRFIADREGAAQDDLTPLVLGRAVLAAFSTALVWWAGSVEPDPGPAIRRAVTVVLLPGR